MTLWKAGTRFLVVFLSVSCAIYALQLKLSEPSSPTMYTTPSLRAALDPYKGTLLAPLLKPRVPGTQGALDAREHIVEHLKRSQWTVETHEFTADTPLGSVPMANIVARPRNARASRPRLTLAAHYDSKRLPHGFIGATDSAFPCALLIYLATLDKKPSQDFDLIFFDGEEAFDTWSATDSIYGARALASAQESAGTLPSTLVLLDLLGAKPRQPIPSWFKSTEHLHKQLASINPRLVGGRNLHEFAGQMEDDHVPYVERGVPVLHLIPALFPSVWHTADDNAEALDWDTMQQWAHLFETWLY